MTKHIECILFICIIAMISCGGGKGTSNSSSQAEKLVDITTINREATKFQILDPSFTGITANNVVTETPNFNYFLWSAIYMGTGVGIADFNNDGLPDVYMGQNMSSDRLYINKGGMKFEDISSSALPQNKDWTTGVSVVDINNDGWMDIYVCTFGPNINAKDRKNRLLVNQKNNTFKEEAAQYGIDDTGFTIMATFFDVDKDGDKDLYVVNQPMDGKLAGITGNLNPKDKSAYSDKLYIRNKSGRYRDKSKDFGIDNYAFGLNVLVNDINEDGWLDLYISNDYEKPDFIYINQEGKGFKNEIEQRTGHISNFSMGSDIGDINNDGLNDIITLDMASSDHYKSKTNMNAMNEKAFWDNVDQGNYYQYMFNALHLNQGDGHYSEIAQMSKVAQTDWSWSVLMEDFNSDGLKDIYITNGIKKDIRNNDFTQTLMTDIRKGKKDYNPLDLMKRIPSNPVSNYFFENGGNLTFSDETESSGAYAPDFSTGAAVADLDRDGDLDIIASVSEGPSKLLENKTIRNAKVLKYTLDSELWNTFLNAEFIVKTNCGTQRKDFITTRGYNSSSWDQILFAVPDGCEIIEGYVNTIYGDTYALPTDVSESAHILKKVNLTPTKVDNGYKREAYFKESSALMALHKENAYNDYDVEVLLPHKLSEDGPCSATADVDNDGKVELFIGGSRGIPAQQYKSINGQWSKVESEIWESYKGSENSGFTFFDADGDNDLDLYICNGGNESVSKTNDWLIDQLLINDGKGNFTLDNDLPKLGKNSSTCIAKDIDSDGDQDLVVFCGHKVGAYPEHYNSYILKNDKGKFVVSSDLDVGLDGVELVSEAVEVDYNGDGKMDIIAVGAWSNPQVLIWDGKKLKLDEPAELAELHSWWNTINTADLNGDGKKDIILGSFGENNKFHPSKKKPLEIFGTDFDESGSNDVVLAKHYNDKVVPTRGRECSSQQIPNIKEKFPTYNEFALAGIEDILDEEMIEKSVHKKITGMSHLILWNTDTGWKVEHLNAETQIAPLKSIAVIDVNKDGVEDIIGIGNHYGAEVETARYDAGYGWVILGNKDKKLEYNAPRYAGLWLDGDGRSLEVVQNGKSTELIALFNNDKAKVYTLNR